MTWSEHLGRAIGAGIAPIFELTSELRHARTFHPRGDVADAIVTPYPAVREEDRALAERLSGPALVRFSDALSKGKARWPDVLGCAVRFGATVDSPQGRQDLLFATILSPWTMPVAPFTTRVSDYLRNDYFAMSPYEVEGHPRVYFRLHPDVDPAPRADPSVGATEHRRRILTDAVSHHAATLVLGLSKHVWGPFHPIAELSLSRVSEDHPAELRFDAFSDGLGIIPRGFVHALRKRVYSASQQGRADSGE